MERDALTGSVIIGGFIFGAAWLGRPPYQRWRARRRGEEP
jgi:hypothetical protein